MTDMAQIKLFRASVDLAIRDISFGTEKEFEHAKRYIKMGLFSRHVENARYPVELLDTLKQVLSLSKLQRQSAYADIMSKLKV